MDALQTKKLMQILITSLLWDINFRLTYKNNYAHMDLGSYSSVKFDITVILIKNIVCSIIFLLIFVISKKLNASKKNSIELKNLKDTKNKYIYRFEKGNNLFLGTFIIYHDLNTNLKIFLFSIKLFLLIVIIYIIEEIYFIIGNTHFLDRLNVAKRNLGILVSIFIFSPLLIKKQFHIKKHQLYPSLIVIILSIFLIIYVGTTIPRFKKIYTALSFFYYMLEYILMGIEIVLIKYLTDILYAEPSFILFFKGVIGTITFLIINKYYRKEEIFDFIDKIVFFEYDYLYEDFSIVSKIFYILTTIILEYFKIFIINEYSESHFLSAAMISDIFFFPLYLIEKFWIQKFPITTSSTFYLSIIFGVINVVLLLVINEIIELKFCGIEKELNKNIEIRNNLEMSYMININEDSDSELGSKQEN